MINRKTSKLLYCFIISFFCISNIFAQEPTISGKVVNKKKLPVEFVNVTLLKNDTVFVEGMTTDSLGIFSFQAQKGKYKLILEKFGTEFINKYLEFNEDINLGAIEIDEFIALEELTINVRKKLVERKVDRMVFNVENSIAAQGMDGMDALASTPMLNVDANGGISVVGKSGVSVMIDGKLLNLSGSDLVNYIRSLRSDNISKIEVITTPPAKYEAQGNSGLVNIVLKKNTNLGLNFLVSTALSQASKFTNSNNFIVNYSNNKLKTSLSFYQFDSKKISTEDGSLVGEQSRVSTDKRLDFGNGWGSNLNIDYKLGEKSNIGLIYDYGANHNNMNINSISVYKNKNITDRDLITYSEDRSLSKNHTLNAYYDLKIDSTKTMSVIANYFSTTPKTNVNFVTEDKINSSQYKVLNTSHVDYQIASGQVDFTLPYRWASIETGTKFSSFSNNSSVDYYNYKVLDRSKSNQFNYDEKNYALYLSLSKKITDKWTAMAGLRYEYSWIVGHSVTLNTTTKYNYGKFFPSFYLLYQPNDNHVFNVNFSRRINRPNFRAIDPFRWYSGPFEYSTGNPLLQPSYNYNFELAYTLKNKFSVTLYWQKLNNAYDQVGAFQGDNYVSTYLNYFTQSTFGTYLNYSDRLFNWWETNTSLYAGFLSSEVFNLNAVAQNGSTMYYSTQNTFTLSKSLYFLLNYWQSLPSRTGNQYAKTMSNLSLGFRLYLIDNKLQISLIANDLFKQNLNHGEVYYTNNTQYYNNYYDLRRINLSLSYRWGSSKTSKLKSIDFSEKDRAN